MKKIFTLLAVALCAIGASAQTVEWNFSDSQWEAKKYAEVTEIDGLTIYGASGKEITIEANSKTVDEVSYTKRLKFGGTGAFSKDVPQNRVLSFEVNGKCSIYVVLAHGSSTGDARSLNIDGIVDGKKTNIGSISVNASETKSGTVEYNTDKATTIYIYSAKSGINLYDIKVTPKVTIGTTNYATFCASATCVVPTGLTAYTAAYNSSTGKVDLKEVADGIIPAKVGVILKGAAGDYAMAAAETTATELAGNELVGLTEAHEVAADDNAYILVNDEGEVKFGKATVGSTIAAGKVYLPIANANAAKLVSMDFGGTNGINAVETVEANDGAYYTLSGVKTLKPAKGQLYIHNGKKFLAK